MKSKKSLTESILKSIQCKSQDLNQTQEIKIDSDSFIMVPINHPKINEIIKLLNNFEDKNKTINKSLNINNKKELENHSRLIITLNDILKSNEEKLIIPKNSIITPMACDYIKQNKIEVIFTKNKEK